MQGVTQGPPGYRSPPRCSRKLVASCYLVLNSVAASSPWIISREHRDAAKRSAGKARRSGPWMRPGKHREGRSAGLARRFAGRMAEPFAQEATQQRSDPARMQRPSNAARAHPRAARAGSSATGPGRNAERSGPAGRWSTTLAATPSCGASPSWHTRRRTRFANTVSPAPGGRRSPGGSASGSSGCLRSSRPMRARPTSSSLATNRSATACWPPCGGPQPRHPATAARLSLRPVTRPPDRPPPSSHSCLRQLLCPVVPASAQPPEDRHVARHRHQRGERLRAAGKSGGLLLAGAEGAGSRRSWFEDPDRPALKALPADRYEYAEWRKARVNIDYHPGRTRTLQRPRPAGPLRGRHPDHGPPRRGLPQVPQGGRASLRIHRKGGYATEPSHMPAANRGAGAPPSRPRSAWGCGGSCRGREPRCRAGLPQPLDPTACCGSQFGGVS